MTWAIELSIENVERGGGPFGSLIVKDGKIIAEGSNKVTLSSNPDATAHGEMCVIRDACKKLNNFSLYELRQGLKLVQNLLKNIEKRIRNSQGFSKSIRPKSFNQIW